MRPSHGVLGWPFSWGSAEPSTSTAAAQNPIERNHPTASAVASRRRRDWAIISTLTSRNSGEAVVASPSRTRLMLTAFAVSQP